MDCVNVAEIVVPANVRFISYAETPQMLANAERPYTADDEDDGQLLINQMHRLQWEKRLKRAVDEGCLTLCDSVGYPVAFAVQGAMLDVNELATYLDGVSAIRILRQPSPPMQYTYPEFERLEPLNDWRGGMLSESDKLSLDDAARFASEHAGKMITASDFMRAAARGQIRMKAIVHRTVKVEARGGGVLFNKGEEDENIVPANSIPTLPLSACNHLAATGRATWRTFDGYQEIEGQWAIYTKGWLKEGEPSFVTCAADCRVLGYDVHALADAYLPEPVAQHAPSTLKSIKTLATLSPTTQLPDPQRRLALLRKLGGDAIYKRGGWQFTGIGALVSAEVSEGRKRSSEKTVRDDLREAADLEREERRAGPFSGLGSR